MDASEKVFENKIRQTLERRGYRLEKSRLRDEQAQGYGKYWVWDLNNHIIRVPDGHVAFSATGPETARKLLKRNGMRLDECAVTLDEIADWMGVTR